MCLLQTASAQAELQAQREQAARLQDEASAVRRSCEEKCSELTSFLDKYQEKSRELEEARMKLQAERLGSRWRTSPLRPSRAAPVRSQCFLNLSYRVFVFSFNICCRHEVSEERKVSSERTERMRVELESLEVRLEEERKRSADLLLQVAFTSKKNK